MSHKQCFTKRKKMKGKYEAAIWAAIDMIPRPTSESVDGKYNVRRCSVYKGGMEW